MWQELASGQETVLVLTVDSMLSELDKQDMKESNCQTFARQGETVLQKSYFTCSLSHILSRQVEGGCPNAAEELSVTVQAVRCPCH